MEPVVKDLDLSAINLVIDDRDPQAIFDASLATFAELAPTATLRNGSVEAILLEAIATAAADVVYALNRVPAKAVEGILNLYGIPRFAGSPATGTVTLVLDGTRTLTVAAGQRMQDPATGIVLTVSANTTGTSVSTLAVPMQAEEPGGAGNAIASGAPIDLVDQIPYVASAAASTAFSGGADPETDAAYVDRASTVLARVSSSLVLPIHFVAYALQDARVGRATAVDLYQPGGTAGSNLGHLTLYTYGRAAQLSSSVREELRAAMQAISAAMITVHVEPAGIVTQAVTLTVQALPGYSTSTVQASVVAALQSWMSPDQWDWGRDIMATEIIDVAADVAGVDYVTTVTTPSTTVAVGASQLAKAGTITCTVTS